MSLVSLHRCGLGTGPPFLFPGCPPFYLCGCFLGLALLLCSVVWCLLFGAVECLTVLFVVGSSGGLVLIFFLGWFGPLLSSLCLGLVWGLALLCFLFGVLPFYFQDEDRITTHKEIGRQGQRERDRPNERRTNHRTKQSEEKGRDMGHRTHHTQNKQEIIPHRHR